MQKKGQTKKSVSAVVFTNSVPNFLGVGYKNIFFCWKPKGQKCEKKVELKSSPRLTLKICPIVLRNIVGQIFNSTKCVLFFFLSFSKMAFSLQKEDFFKKEEHFGQIFNSKKGNFWTDFHLQHTLLPSVNSGFEEVEMVVPRSPADEAGFEAMTCQSSCWGPIMAALMLCCFPSKDPLLSPLVQRSVKGGYQVVARVSYEDRIPLPSFNLNIFPLLTSCVPQFILTFFISTSAWPETFK